MTDKYYFRVRRYLRNRGETEFDKYQVQLENNVHTITKWDYANHPKPSLENLRQISTTDVNDEITKTKIDYTSDIYVFTSQENNRIVVSVNRENFSSSSVQNQIRLTKNGLYRITVSGEQVTRGQLRQPHTVLRLKIFKNEDTQNFVELAEFVGGSSFGHVCLLSVTEVSKLELILDVSPASFTYNLNGHILVEFV